MEAKTYLELLAENDEEARKEFAPNAKELLTANFVEYDDHVDGHDNHPDELEDQHEFQREQGSHQVAALVPPPEKDVHASTTGVRYDKNVQIHVISIDSRFRSDQGDNPSNFLFKLLTPIKNVISVRLSSLEIPNTWYTFSEIRGNTSLIVNVQNAPNSNSLVQSARVVITEGNYTLNTLQTNDFLFEIFNQLNAAFSNVSFSVYFNTISGKITLSCFTKVNPPAGGYTYFNQPRRLLLGAPPTTGFETPLLVSFNFADSVYSTRDNNWGLGFNLGYQIKETKYATSHAADSIPDVNDTNYVFLSLNPDWRVVEHNQPDSTQTAAFAKVIVNVPKNDIVYDNGGNTITKQYYLRQPTNISVFNVSILDEYENYIQLEGGHISLTLEVTEVLHASLYETMRT
uniref:Uncharacterized protein n=1 Tax=viral metagenome TaxID=1070528 RepID=A0A6C0JL38_9ZZZZ